MQENKTKTQDIEVIAIGKPSFKSLPDYQSDGLFALLLKHISELAQGGDD